MLCSYILSVAMRLVIRVHAAGKMECAVAKGQNVSLRREITIGIAGEAKVLKNIRWNVNAIEFLIH